MQTERQNRARIREARRWLAGNLRSVGMRKSAAFERMFSRAKAAHAQR